MPFEMRRSGGCTSSRSGHHGRLLHGLGCCALLLAGTHLEFFRVGIGSVQDLFQSSAAGEEDSLHATRTSEADALLLEAEMPGAALRVLTEAHSSGDGTEHGSNSSGTHGDEHDAHEGGHHTATFYATSFFLVAFGASAIAQRFAKVIPYAFRPPHSVLLFVMGSLMGWSAMAQSDSEWTTMVRNFATVDPHVLFWVLLPSLLYEDASGCQWHVMSKVMPSALLLALPGVIVNSVLTGLIIRYCFYEWTIEPSLLLGSILSATDPVAVVGALNVLQAPAKLSHLISGESLLNDGSAVALFQIFFEVAAGRRDFEVGYSIWKLVRLACGGPLFGLAVALVLHQWLLRTRRFSIQVLLIIVCIFGLFFVSEHQEVAVSGVLAVVTFGFFMAAIGKYAILETEHQHHSVVSFLALLSNEAIFVIAGIVAFKLTFNQQRNDIAMGDLIETRDWFDCMILYVVIHVTRTFVMVLCWPLLRRWGYGLSLKEAIICIFGGLRGAVGLSLGLLVVNDVDMDQRDRERIAFHTSGIVFLTLLVNGTTVSSIYKRLKITSPRVKEHHERLLDIALQHADIEVRRKVMQFKDHWFFHNCDLDIVMNLVPKMHDLTSTAGKDHYGRRIIADNSTKRIKENMDALCQKVGTMDEDLGEHVAQKIRFNRSKMAAAMLAPNPFRPQAGGDDLDIDEEEVWLAIKIVHKNKHSGKYRQELQAVWEWALRKTGMPEDKIAQHTIEKESHARRAQEARLLPESALRAKYRWLRARALVDHVSHVILHNRLQLKQKRMEKVQRFARYSQYALSTNVEDLMEEVFQTVVNATRSDYQAMLEAHTISQNAFDVLSAALDVQEEVVHGDFREDEWPTKELRERAAASKAGRFRACFEVAWRQICKTISWHQDTMVSWVRRTLTRSVVLEWLWLEQDVETIVAFVMTADHLLEEAKELHLFEEDVVKPLSLVRERALSEKLFELSKAYPAFFFVSEHIICARLVIEQMRQTVEHLVEEGTLTQGDHHHITKALLRPAALALRSYIPVRETISLARGSRPRKLAVPELSVKVDHVLAWIYKAFIAP